MGIDLVLLVATALGVAAGVGVLCWMARGEPAPQVAAPMPRDTAVPASFVFSGRELVDMADTAGFFDNRLAHSEHDDWTNVVRSLGLRFADVPKSPTDLPEGETQFLAKAPRDPGKLIARRDGTSTRLVLSGNPREGMSGAALHKLHTALAELRMMRAGLGRTPSPIFARDGDGNILWANAAYIDLATKLGFEKATEGGQPPELFEPLNPEEGSYSIRRDCLSEPGGDVKHWYDICAVDAGQHTITFTMDVDAVVNAEIAQRNFVQTLTKTFAQLSIGLAIFNRDRQLALFNPALVDLTELPVDFLSGRPTIRCFFDMLRDNHMMPEPKNYASWRERIGTLVAAASDGNFHETWSLPSGQTYRVTGRPHPDGAVAFLFEDISHEVSLTRSFRSELALGNAVLDQMDSAMAVFSADGVLAFSNAQFRDVWGVDPDSAFADTTIADALAIWRSKSDPATKWEEIESALSTGTVLDDVQIIMSDHSRRLCRVRPLINGARMVAFSTDSQVPAVDMV